MYLLQAGFNGGDILFQLIMFILLLGIPAALLFLFLALMKKRKSRLDRIEKKLDSLLKEKESRR
ncbi:hypothetical protein D3H55_04415 [Bacillus salacetis]|uniref:DUF4083 domain-containing protein n=1 Tax=Bacillus salacetis TaxID=2315464 RepID=A0A3A1R401_9BACI|nr:hypothetical protein [Bacillus salacetis]RIW37289.1 hypothetical protein D3H55_04415 [Bacillus salacetis]